MQNLQPTHGQTHSSGTTAAASSAANTVQDDPANPVVAQPNAHHAALGLPVPGSANATFSSLPDNAVHQIIGNFATGSCEPARLAMTARASRRVVTPRLQSDFLAHRQNQLNTGFIGYNTPDLCAKIDEAPRLPPEMFVQTYRCAAAELNNLCDDGRDSVPLLERLRGGLRSTADQALRFDATQAVTERFLDPEFTRCPKTQPLEAFYRAFMEDINTLDAPQQRDALHAQSATGMHMIRDDAERQDFWNTLFADASVMAELPRSIYLEPLARAVPTLASPHDVQSLDRLFAAMPALSAHTRANLVGSLTTACSVLPFDETRVVRFRALRDITIGLVGPDRQKAAAAIRSLSHMIPEQYRAGILHGL